MYGCESWTIKKAERWRMDAFVFVFSFFFIFKLYKIVLVMPNIIMNPPQVYMCSPSWTLLPAPSPYHPSGSSQCTSPKHPVDAFELWCWRRLESPSDCKEIKPVHPKGNQSWIFTGRTDAEAETPILWPSDVKNWLIGKDPDARKDWRWEEKRMTEDEMVGWHHWLKRHEFE